MPRVGPSKDKKRRAPTTRVKAGGKVNRRLEAIAAMYKKTVEGVVLRWVYSPQHKPDLSNVVNRQADGFVQVYVKDLSSDDRNALPGLKPDDPIRVGDVVLMAIDAGAAAEIREELDQRAVDERTRVDEEYQDATDGIRVPGMRDEYKARPRGRSVTEEVEREAVGPDSHSVDPTV